jgi:hypothetical protein
MTAPPRARLLHTIVAMGVALTGGTLLACGGATATIPPGGGDGGQDMNRDGDTADQYYQGIGIYIPDGSADRYAVILPVEEDAYPVIGFDAGTDAYGTIKTPYPDGGSDAYPMIGIAVDAG